MAKSLVKIAKELNVGTSTIVDHLLRTGFEIENKPNAKLSPEMENELMKEFQKSIAIKEEADKMVIGTRPTTPKREEPTVKKEIFSAPSLRPKPPVEMPSLRAEPVAPPVKEAAPVVVPTPQPEPVKEAAPEKEPLIQLTVKGKIDLDSINRPAPPKLKKDPPAVEQKPPVVEKPTAPVVESPKVAPQPVAVEKPSTPADQLPAVSTPDVNQTIRAEAPELRGLKIQGKIDLDKFKTRSKPKKDEKKPGKPGEKPAADGKSSTGASSTNADNKRKRKRKKVLTPNTPSTQSSGGGGSSNASPNTSSGTGNSRAGNGKGPRGRNRKTDDVKEVSQKEIDEKIKATMARLQGGGKKKRQKLRRDNRDRIREKQELAEAEAETGKLQLTEFVSVQELANLMEVPVTEVIMTCMNLGVIVAINQRLDAEIIEFVAGEFGHEVEFISADEEGAEEDIIDAPEDLLPRAPIVTVMGHVDHGKTSLLDYIRSANVVSGEAGGITQHIGAYEVVVQGNKRITFLDTPGHEAFTAMRARGAKVTDIAVIIIAADDNIMPQTKEAISHAQAAGVPMVFAINKIDKDGANPERIKQSLAEMNYLVEDWGGKYQSQEISAKSGLNIDLLLEKILLESELLELHANPERLAIGTILEASLDKGRGYVSKGLVQTGTMKVGDVLLSGEYTGKVKAMFNERGTRIKEAGPSAPVLILGLNGAPQAGEKFKVMAEEGEARQLAARRAQISREQANRARKRISLDEIGRRLALGTFKELNLIVKGDVDGSIEALADSLIKLSVETVQVNVIHKAVGQIVESDVLLASASDAIIIGFQVRPSQDARKLAEREGVEIKTYSIIYEAIDVVKSAIEGMLEPTREEKILGQIDVREVYKITKVGTVAGCLVTEGKAMRNSHIRLVRDGIVVYPTREGVNGEFGSLKRYKEDVKEIKNGMECGVTIKNFNDIKVGDVIEAYEVIEIRQKLS